MFSAIKKNAIVRTKHGSRRLRVLSDKRWIAGGAVVTVTWESVHDIDAARARLSNGSWHPAHLPGFTWEEPVENIVEVLA